MRLLVIAATIESDPVKHKRPTAVLLLLVLSGCFAFGADTKEKQAAATKVASDFLALIDNGKYGEAYKQLAPPSEPAEKKSTWQSDVSRYRRQIGKLHGRKLLSAEYSTKVAGGEEGEYVIVTFMSSFERLGSALEVVIPELQPDGTWIISGYSIKPADVTE